MCYRLLCSILILFTAISDSNAQDFTTRFEKSRGKETAAYGEIISFYKKLACSYPQMKLMEMGTTDAGFPLHLAIISNDKDFNPLSWKKKNKLVFFINNAIHPGEPDGIDASMMYCRDILQKKKHLPDNVIIAVIPVYNIGGCLNRNRFSRVNQNGPDSFGFRGNSQNLDLNRDFIKCDSREAISFAAVFHFLDPVVFLDTHVSDGADFQHTMTLITTQYEKLGGDQGLFLKQVFEPSIRKNMKTKNWDIIPYVDFGAEDFDKGITMFYDPPRYSSGYAALFHTYAFISETHMLKPYLQRVQSTYDLIETIVQSSSVHAIELISKRKAERIREKNEELVLGWKAKSETTDSFYFKGYELKNTISAATGLNRKWYDHSRPYEKYIPFYDIYEPVSTTTIPGAYIMSQAWQPAINILKANGVKMSRLKKDSMMSVTAYHIDSFKTYPRPYEKHYKHYAIHVSPEKQFVQMFKGDYVIDTDQPNARFISYILEPEAEDGLFAWNFFDGILQQKEGYSDYRWEELAADYLSRNPGLKKDLEEKKRKEPEFAANSSAILEYIYRQSPYFERVFMRFPVYRVEKQ